MANQPNLFQLSGGDLQVSYSTSSLVGQPQFSYHDPGLSEGFSGDRIKVEHTEIGTIVSVVIRQTIDAGSTTFSLIIPSIGTMPASGSVAISTIGITTIHKLKLFGHEPGQSSINTVRALNGTGLIVVF